MKTFDVHLNDGFNYHFNNEVTQAKFITISAFSMRNMEKVAPIKEIVMQAMGNFYDKVDDSLVEDIKQATEDSENDVGEGKDEDKDEDVKDGRQLLSIIYMNCKEGDVKKLWAHMKKLLTDKVCSIDGETAFNGSHIDNLSPDDFEKLCGEYIGNFITS